MQIKGVIFDFNGTLFWDTSFHNKAWDIFLEKHELNLDDLQKNKKIHGKNNYEIFTSLFSRDLSINEIQSLSIEKENIYQELCLQQRMELAPGAVDFMEFLRIQQIPFTIATASDIYNLEFYFKHLELDQYFDKSLVVYSDGNVKSKPHPEIFYMAMSKLNLKANEVLIFEDSIAGIKAAENSKAQEIIIVNSNNDDYSKWNYKKIVDFSEVDRRLFTELIPR